MDSATKKYGPTKSDRSIERELLQQGVILIYDDITEQTFAKLRKQLLHFVTIGNPDIEIRIDSEGGESISGNLMYDHVRLYKGKTIGIVTREAMSMASVILQACTTRKIYRHAWLHIHTMQTFGSLSLTELSDAADFADLKRGLEKGTNFILESYALRAKIERAAIRKLMDEDRRMFAAEALELGFVDEII
jgi:ATP-dependent protease ClpP protease subunit